MAGFFSTDPRKVTRKSNAGEPDSAVPTHLEREPVGGSNHLRRKLRM